MAQPIPITASDVQQLLDPDTLLIEFALGSERSFAWVVSSRSVKAFELPARLQIEKMARVVYEGFSVSDAAIHGFSPNAKSSDSQVHEKAAEELSKLLFAGIEPLLERKRLVIVADGFLQHVSFAMLPRMKSSGNVGTEPDRLITDNEVITLPAASVLALQRRQFSNRPAAPLGVAIFADPVFDNEDPRSSHTKRGSVGRLPSSRTSRRAIQHSAHSVTSGAAPIARALRSVGFDKTAVGIPRLPFSRNEAAAIAAASSPRESLQALGFKASLQTLRTTDLIKYRYIHFATHGLLNSEHPELSGILLSMVDENGKRVDGFLQLYEIYNLKLAADLVVLSACQTAVGKDVKGEGLVGLTRGFMYAGAASVVGSLWKVDDAATAALMEQFYKEMFTNGKRPAAALREAQIHISKQKRWRSPYYWAGFVLQGEWR